MPDKYIQVQTEEEYAAAAALFSQYASWLNIDLSFQHFEEELSGLKSMYAEPSGGIILCKIENDYAGCIAIRKIDVKMAELKRMYVVPGFQKKGIGSILLNKAIDLAKKYRYKKLRLDTLSNMKPAIDLYMKNGFYEIPAYYFNPQETAVFFERLL